MSIRHFLLDEGPSPSTQPCKTQVFVVLTNPLLHHNFTIQLGSSTITPSKTARNLRVVIDDQLNFSDHIAKTAQSCRFALYNISKIRPFLSEHATQLLVQALVLSRLNYCNALLAGLPANSIKPLQLIQNASAKLVFNELKRMHFTPLFTNLLCTPLPKFTTYVRSRSLCSASENCIKVPAQRCTQSLSQSFTVNVPSWWNDLPSSIQVLQEFFKKTFQETAKDTFYLFTLAPIALSILFLF